MASPYAAPWTWTSGVRSLRASLYAALALPAQVGAQVGIVSNQATALLAGDDVTFSAAQITALLAPGGHPSLPDLTTAESWRLSGMDTLTAVV